MYSPINKIENYFIPKKKNKDSKNKSNSLNSKKLILSRNIDLKDINNNNKNKKNSSNLYSTKLDFSINIKSINNSKKEENNKNKEINKKNKTTKNYYKKILNFPLSPENKNIKICKLNNLNINEVSNSFNYLNKDITDINYKRIVSSRNLFKNKINSDQSNRINSFIYSNTNNINLNVNFINKGIILNNFNENNNFSLLFNTNNNISYRSKNKNKNNKNIFNISSYNKNISINMDNNTPEEIHFKSVKYMQEIQNFNRYYG